jgi:hypothetical protein
VQRLADFERSRANAGTASGQAGLLTMLRAVRKDVSGHATPLPVTIWLISCLLGEATRDRHCDLVRL